MRSYLKHLIFIKSLLCASYCYRHKEYKSKHIFIIFPRNNSRNIISLLIRKLRLRNIGYLVQCHKANNHESEIKQLDFRELCPSLHHFPSFSHNASFLIMAPVVCYHILISFYLTGGEGVYLFPLLKYQQGNNLYFSLKPSIKFHLYCNLLCVNSKASFLAQNFLVTMYNFIVYLALSWKT